MKLAKITTRRVSIYFVFFLIFNGFFIKSADKTADLASSVPNTATDRSDASTADEISAVNLAKKQLITQKSTGTVSNLEKFYTLLEKYRPNAPWIIQELMELSLQEFLEGFEYIIDILTQPQNRWFYFTDKKEKFDQNEYWTQCLWQCIYYDQWLKKNAFVLNNKGHDSQLAFANEIDAHLAFSKKGVPSLKNYLNFLEFKPLHQFYAFYIDCLSHCFCYAVQNAYLSIEDANAYKLYITIAQRSFKKIVALLSEIKSSRFFNNYRFAAEKYKGILAILSNELLLKKMKRIKK